MLHSFFDRTLYIHHVERFGLCKKKRKKKNINVRAPKSMRRKKEKKEK